MEENDIHMEDQMIFIKKPKCSFCHSDDIELISLKPLLRVLTFYLKIILVPAIIIIAYAIKEPLLILLAPVFYVFNPFEFLYWWLVEETYESAHICGNCGRTVYVHARLPMGRVYRKIRRR